MGVALAVETDGLVKRFGTTCAVDGIDLAVPRGSVYGFLGPNGAGKTTTIRVLATLLRPDGGTAAVLGHDVVREADAVRARIGLTGQYASVDEDLTGLENLVLLGRLQGLSWSGARARGRQLLAGFGLGEASRRQVKHFSGGMRRRLDIAVSMITTPDLLFLDEPTTGLDPTSRNQVWDLVRAVAARGTTVLLTTQYLDEADQLADRIAVIDRGRVIAEGTSGELKASIGAGALRVRLLDPSQRPAAAALLGQTLGTVVRLDAEPVALSASLAAGRAESGERVAAALGGLARADITVTEFALGQPSLDEVFLALTGDRATTAPEEDAA
jgi:ABC-2 type transport system ATP-binding protein